MSQYNRIRSQAGLIDLQDWARFEVSGSGAVDVLDAVVGCNVQDLFEGRATNTLIPSMTGGVEAIVWLIAIENGFLVIGEPTDRNVIRMALEEELSGHSAVLQDVQGEKFALVLTGPSAETVAEKAFGDEIYSIAFSNVLSLGEPAVLASRIGYFGEYELHIFGDTANKQTVIDTLKQAGNGDALMVSQDILPTLMLEMRTMSRERDIPKDISVFEAGLQWMVDFRKENLRASEVLAQKKGAVNRKCILMIIEDGAEGMKGQPVFIEDQEIGRIQSVLVSETLGKAVALAYLTEEFGVPGLSCAIGTNRQAGETVSAPAFLSRSILNRLGW